MSDADTMYAALVALRNEAVDNHGNVARLVEQGGGTLDAAVAAGIAVDTAAILADLATRLAEILSPEESAIDEGDDEEEDEDEDEAAGGLEPEEAALLRRLLTSYRDLMTELAAPLPPEDPRHQVVARDTADCERAIGIVNDLELEPEDGATA